MKIIIALVLALTMVSVSYAGVVRDGNTFKSESVSTASQDTETKYEWQDKEGNKYPIYITKKGACYVKRISKKTGKEYKYYLPKDIQAEIQKELGISVP